MRGNVLVTLKNAGDGFSHFGYFGKSDVGDRIGGIFKKGWAKSSVCRQYSKIVTRSNHFLSDFLVSKSLCHRLCDEPLLTKRTPEHWNDPGKRDLGKFTFSPGYGKLADWDVTNNGHSSKSKWNKPLGGYAIYKIIEFNLYSNDPVILFFFFILKILKIMTFCVGGIRKL